MKLSPKIKKQEAIKMAKHEAIKNGVIFPVGEKNPYGQYFIGQSYYQSLVADPAVKVGVGNVTFEPGCRNNWQFIMAGTRFYW